MQNKTPDLRGYDHVLPGMPNLHSHAFQRAMAGLTEKRGSSANDSFWTWRTLMYQFAGRLTPEHMHAIARWLYIEMLKSGYTHVGEFHYIHHQADGTPYDQQEEMALAILRAAKEVGIGITLLPVYYATSDFGGKSPTDGQRRFTHTPEGYLSLLERLKPACESHDAALGIAPHSLRATTPEMLREILGGLGGLDLKNCPKHIHIAEQQKEVESCMDWSGKRPVEWMLDNVPLDSSWCFVHATHLSDSEVKELAKSGVIAGLCPTTEANLGDGLFPAVAFLQEGGRMGIGSDSHISVSVAEELRLLEYGQRLSHQARACLSDETSCAKALWNLCVAGGKQALGVHISDAADYIALSSEHPLLTGKTEEAFLDTAVFALPTLPVTDVFVNGMHVVKEGKHAREEEAGKAFVKTLETLLA